MLRDSIINNVPGSKYLIIRQQYIDLFAGDHALACLVSCLEDITNQELSINKAGHQPWFRARTEYFVHQCLGLYSDRTIRERLLILEYMSLIKIGRGRVGSTRKYLFCYETINYLLQIGHKFQKEELFTDEQKNNSSTAK